jgi:hypothetical protein
MVFQQKIHQSCRNHCLAHIRIRADDKYAVAHYFIPFVCDALSKDDQSRNECSLRDDPESYRDKDKEPIGFIFIQSMIGR